jgi:hypoxanthine phosphoribosyltransferase
MKQLTKRYITWQEVESLIEALAETIRKSPTPMPKDIYGVTRGGLIPAVMLSHALGIPMTKFPTPDDTLIVDDIVDTGKTVKAWSLNAFAALLYKPNTSSEIPTYFGHDLQEDVWIVFPWEKKDSETIPDRDL